MKRIFLKGDCHGEFQTIQDWVNSIKDNPKQQALDDTDVLILLGDVGINYFLNIKDSRNKAFLCAQFPGIILCIMGNHEKRPNLMPNMHIITEKFGGKVYQDAAFPRINWTINGEIYNINGKTFFPIDGAYSVDKYYRLDRGWAWFPEEIIDDEDKEKVRQTAMQITAVDYVLSHTCPISKEPIETFLDFIDQSTVDTSEEEFLQEIWDNLYFEKWFCGHWHTEKDGKLTFLYHRIIELMQDGTICCCNPWIFPEVYKN